VSLPRGLCPCWPGLKRGGREGGGGGGGHRQLLVHTKLTVVLGKGRPGGYNIPMLSGGAGQRRQLSPGELIFHGVSERGSRAVPRHSSIISSWHPPSTWWGGMNEGMQTPLDSAYSYASHPTNHHTLTLVPPPWTA